MTTTTFSHASSGHAHDVQAIREFLVSWFKATPLFIVYSVLKG